MTSRKRAHSTPNVSPAGVNESNISESKASASRSITRGKRRGAKARDLRRRQLIESLEARHLMAGPQLIGIQPNDGALITDGSVRDSSPRVLTFGFDEDQVLNPNTFDGIQISRAGEDGQLGTGDDVPVEPGLITLGDPNQNEVVVRFAEALPDDRYRIEVFGFDDAGLGVTGLRNTNNEFFIPSDPTQRSEVIDFRLSLGALVESVVPQPVVRNNDGSLTQNRNEIVIYFNEDPLFVEDDDNGQPTQRSAENPRFYQLLLTQETVRTTDDVLFRPDEVIYDSATHTARLIFSDDINALPGVPLEGGTWRLRVGTAVDNRVDLILPPEQLPVSPSSVTDFQYDGLRVRFSSLQVGESGSGTEVSFEDSGAGGLSVRLDGGGNVIFDFGGSTPTVDDLKDVVLATPAVNAVLAIRSERDGDSTQGGDLTIPRSVVGAPPMVLAAAGETLSTSLDVGIFGQDDAITSLVLSESIDPQNFDIELLGGNDDPGHLDLDGIGTQLRRHINPNFGADTTDGITEILYNFQGIFDSSGSTDFLNQITQTQRERIREVLNLWSSKIGIQFRETADMGVTFAVGDIGNLQSRPGTTLIGPGFGTGSSISQTLQASIRIDPTFQESALVFSNQTSFGLDYGEDFTRKAVAGVGFLLGLEQATDLPPQTIMALSSFFLNQSIDTPVANVDLEPIFPGNFDILHGQYIHRPDSVDIDLYRFEVDLDDADKVGQLTVETFAERLPDSSLLDTTLSLFQEVHASAISDLGVGSALQVQFESVTPGRAGNNTEIRFVRSDRNAGDTAVRVNRVLDDAGNPIPNVVLLDLPRRGPNVPTLPAQAVVDAINNDPFASSIIRASILDGESQTDISGGQAAPLPVRLSGGQLQKIAQNDDYFSEDSRVITSLGEGVYYIGVSASGNDGYDPTIPGSGYGGRTQGAYDLHIKFEPQVDEVDVIRDTDSLRAGVPGTPLDGDADGTPGGVHNFWFQTRPLNRILNFTDAGDAVVPGQEIEIVSGNGVVRTYEFVQIGQTATPGNVAVFFSDGSAGFPTPAGNLAAALASAINTRQAETGVSVTRLGTQLVFNGERSIDLSTGFRGAEAIGRNIFVDKTAGPNADGSLARPFNNIANGNVANAFGSALPGDIVRIVGNGGVDGNMATEQDNFSYQIGISNVGGNSLSDGRAMEVPQGVTTMIDAGAILKMRASYISVGSSTLQVDRSGGALQVLGAPRLVQLSPQGDPITTTLIGDQESGINGYDDGSVIITSVRDRVADVAAAGNSPAAGPGDWGGLIYRRDVDQFEGRRDLEDDGVFLQSVNHAEIRYGGSSNVLIDSIQQLVNPIQVVNMRPTITFNEITRSADSAISASPDSFEETSYQAPRFQQAGAFTADYDRVGPEISRNHLVENSVNGLFIRVPTTATQAPRELTVAGRFDDIDVVHVLPENLVVAGQSGGSIQDGFAPSLSLVTARQLAGGTLTSGDYIYKMTYVDKDGFESLPSTDDFSFSVDTTGSSVELTALPTVQQSSSYVSRRLYRAPASANPTFSLIAELDTSTASFIDDGTTSDGVLDLTRQGIRGRLDASLVIDPGLIMKLRGSRIEMGQGTQLLAEGLESNPIVFTSTLDDRFGAGGTFDTNNDNDTLAGAASPDRGDWSGIYAGPTSSVSLDNVQLAYAGGISLLEGGLSRGFVPLELQQAQGRITNSRFEFNDVGQDGAGPVGRFGRLSVAPSTIFIRGSQPIIVGNTFVDNYGPTVNNDGSIIDIDIESMGSNIRRDAGRQTGDIDRISELDDNFGPMIRFNRYQLNDSTVGTQLSGLEIRAGELTTATTFDDTDIAHLLFDSIEVGNLHSSGGLRLLSRPDESLVVKFAGPGTPNSQTFGTGITATGSTSSIQDRVGGSVHVIGMPGSPVILTSLNDDTVGAGLKPDGSQFTDHDGDGTDTRPFANDWRGLYFDQFSNDYNIPVLPELELSTEVAPGLNSSVENAQFLGELAENLLTGDHVRRLGFEVDGYLSGSNDIDVYSFIGSPGTEVWIDIDKTSFTLDTVVELLDENGNVLARSDNSFEETALGAGSQVSVFDPDLEGVTTSLQASAEQYTKRGVGGLYEDYGSTNPRDAGIHFRLAGNTADPNSRSVYFFRVRSASVNPDDGNGGLTGGAYRAQLRLKENQEFPGSVVRYADIRYANQGIHVQGLMSSSPLLGEAQENEQFGGFFSSASNDTVFGSTPGQGAQYIGNLVDSVRNVISVGGELSSTTDVDLYEFEVDFSQGSGLQSTVFDIDYADGFNRPDTNISVFYDPDGVPDFEDPANFPPQLVFFGSSSNVADDLVSPNGENSAIEKLIRGSISNGDPFIGPVALPEGTYYVAITSANQTPTSLSGAVVEPINSVDRIVEDRVDRTNPESPSTANGPEIPRLFSDNVINGSLFTIGVDNQGGHGKPQHFDGTTGPFQPSLGGTRYSELDVSGTFDAPEVVSSTAVFPADLDALDWSIDDDFEIGGSAGFFGTAPNTSTTIPHISVAGNLQNDPGDLYQFTLNTVSRVILDIDNGYDITGEVDDDDDPSTPDVNVDPSSVDVDLVLLEPDPNNAGAFRTVTPPGRVNDSNSVNDGRGGSNSTLDPFIDQTLAPGVYYIAVLEQGSTLTFNADNVTLGGGGGSGVSSYRLHVSVEDHVLPPGSGTISQGAEVLSFDRSVNAESGSVTSEPFDLSGYAAADLPFLYLNRLYQPAVGDSASLTIISDQNPDGTVIHNFTAGSWDQLRLSLAPFAGHSNVQLQVDYTTDGTVSAAIGLRLDDFIVGFAERGETVFGATTGATFTSTGFGGTTGKYQLEMRPATDYASPSFGGTTNLDASFDTNDRHNQSVTLIAPDASQIVDGDTFVLNDGVASQTFEFTTTAGSVTFGNTPVLFAPGNSAAQIAGAIRTAINNQNIVGIEASSSGGADTAPTTDGRLALTGRVNGSFAPVDSARDVTGGALSTDAEGNLLIPAILHNGLGDENYVRTQGQVIVEHNKISDVRGIGVWSEPGIRDFSPRHIRDNALLEPPPVANSYPGAVRNLPTLNDSVLGGLAPGIVIENNTIDQAEYAGIKIDGQIAPLTIETGSGDTITDGSTFVIDAAGTRVVFEFEDIGEGTIPSPKRPVYGSNTNGGDGYRDGHVPVYYRQTDSNPSSVYQGRTSAYTALEVLHAIRESIQGSILVTNGLVELVDVTVGPSLTSQAPTGGGFPGFPASDVNFATPALYIEGASAIYSDDAEIIIDQAPVYEAPQPFARIVNNTIYGNDGTESATPETPSEPDDFLSQATETHIGSSHRDPYVRTVTLGDNSGPLAPEADVDMYRVYLEVGDRLIVDIDTQDDGPDTLVRIFNSTGIAQSFLDADGNLVTVSDNAAAPGYLDPASTVDTQVTDDANTRDAFVDFTASVTGTYFIGVSAVGNDNYDPQSLSDRVSGNGGSGVYTGDYTISVETYAPRSFVMSLNNGSGDSRNPPNWAESDRNGSTAAALIGTSFTVTQIPDTSPLAPMGNGTNEITFRFTGPNTPALINNGGNFEIAVALRDNYRVPDIMRAIQNAFDRVYITGNGRFPSVPNGGPIPAGEADALGGQSGAGADLFEFTALYPPDFNTNGFGHNYAMTNGIGGLTDGAGSTEQYLFIEKVAEIHISPEAAALGLKLDPQPGRDIDQLINETGVMIAGGASPTLLNNVFLNLHESLVVEETRFDGFGEPRRGSDNQPKPMEVIVVGSIFQHDETTITQFNQDMIFRAFEDTGLTTLRAPSNVNGGSDDFNETLGNADAAVQYAEANNFQPDLQSILIDSAVNSLVERVAMANLKNSVGLPISNIVAPDLDVDGILRADNPDVAPPGGIGSSVFKDRGSVELADRVGPIAIAEAPRDNDAENLDTDPNISFINLDSGVYDEFRIQLRDAGDASDPFTGSGIDDSSVVVAEIPGVRPSGANVTVFEDERLLTEGIDYTFNYDETKNIITLTPLAGIWQGDRAYRIQLNNADRNVVIAPSASEVKDGDQIQITDSNGGQVVFEFESGYLLQMPEPVTLEIPTVGTNQGGLIDGGVFTINDGSNPPVVFEFDSNGTTLPSSVPVTLPTDPTPNDANELTAFLTMIANNVATAIQGVIDNPNREFDVDVRVVGTSVVIGSERGTFADASTSGLIAATRTLGLRVPSAGAGVGGVVVGDTFELSDGRLTTNFQFTDTNNPATPGFVGVDITPTGGVGTTPLDADEVALAIQNAIVLSNLELQPSIIGQTVYLNLPTDGSATVPSGQLRPVSVSRTPDDGDLIIFTPNNGDPDVIFEVNRTDEPDGSGGIMDDGVAQDHFALDITRGITGDNFARLVAGEIQTKTIPGLNASQVEEVDGGVVSIGGQTGLGLDTTGSSLEVIGSPDVTGPSTLEVYGPLLMRVSSGTPDDGDLITLIDPAGNPVLLEFDDNATLNNVNATPIAFTRFDNLDTLGASIVAAINASPAGITATYRGSGVIDLGRIDESRVSTTSGQITTQRGIVSDGEVLTISQGSISVSYEFESVNNGGGVAAGNVPVPFQPGSTPEDVANSLAAAINSNSGGLRVSAEVEGGLVRLNDLPGTTVDVSAAPTLLLSGVPGGAIPINISPADSAEGVKQAILEAINSVNTGPEGQVTTLIAEDRGGASLFVDNGTIFEGPITSFFLPAIRDVQGNPLEANREDNTTQFTILMPTVLLDFGDAPDPVDNVPGRYPTLLINDGARHVVTEDLYLGSQIDADADGQPSVDADGDDSVSEVTETGTLFTVSVISGEAVINVNAATVDPLTRDGDTITITTGVSTATLEFDLNGRFDEDNFAIQPDDPTSVPSILEAIEAAIIESPVQPAGIEFVSTAIVINSDDEDGISFSSDRNPGGVLNKNVALPIDVTVTGRGILQGWIDYNADGEWSPSEAIRFYDENASLGEVQSLEFTGSPTGGTVTLDYDGTTVGPITFAGTGMGGTTASNIQSALIAAGVGGPNDVVVSQVGLSDVEFTVTFTGVLAGTDLPLLELSQNNLDQGTLLSSEMTKAATPRTQLSLTGNGEQVFTFDTYMPASAPDPLFPTQTMARFRYSRTGNLSPSGLSLSGEVEDYAILLVPGAPPVVTPPQANRTFTVDEDGVLQALDADGTLTPSVTTDNGLIAGVIDPDGDNVAIFPEDTGIRTLLTPNETVAGELDLQADGTFTFIPAPDFNGTVSFTARVTDVKPQNPDSQLINPDPIRVTIEVLPVNDAPVATTADVMTSRTINEDEVTYFFAEDLIDPFYVPGPANEANQMLVFQSVSSVNLGDSVSSLGGILEIVDDGRSIKYTPPADYFGSIPDTFNYVVADVPGGTLISETADKPGTVSVTINPINDAPIAGNDFYNAMEDTPLNIAIVGGGSTVGILDNDVPGPQNEIDPPENQTVSLPTSQFPVQTARGGSVRLENGSLVYRPPGLYSGPDSFTYRIVDDMGAESFGTVSISVGGENDAPIFEGVDGQKDSMDNPIDEITFPEAKPAAQLTQFDLNTWFSDPENDNLTYTVTSSNQSIVAAELEGSTLTLTRPAFAFGTVSLTVMATDTGNLTTTETVTVRIANENDSPILIGSLDPLSGNEDQTVIRELTTVFSDPDGDDLDYTVTRLGSIVRPTAQQITDHPLIRSIVFVGDQMRITPEPNQFGVVDIEIEASDGSFRVSDAFTLTINAVPDTPIAVDDGYNVPIGSTLRILSPASGLLRNDSDADGDTILIDLDSVTEPSFGTLEINADGTFVYVNTSGAIGTIDQFQYRVIDSTSRTSQLATVQLTLNQSEYQNPIDDLEADVNADGFVSPIDALRIINFLSREADGQSSIPVAEIGSPPPDYYDVNGDGRVSPSDALAVINELGRRQANGREGESIASLGVSSGFVSAGTIGLPSRQLAPVLEETPTTDTLGGDPRDALLAAGLEITSSQLDSIDLLGSESETGASSAASVDEALSLLMDDIDLD
ncbi:tandem-95 repeat protein [Roseiconus nitratireducens]|uniref:Tandem-95 repeat protein n=1 Tax=Roseiconus nitratireducens TaxID=2605748 RepID=A0A5M6DHS0_9BACT|nr:Ig-like domain-containing protein [Roseiconus nitratireducens]KAA5546993.1 tandem-95 repeat protein [Roseiconus nitratireducens]